ncbi:MarR family winged helix-turn-helix transcriptional regulator [Brachybacterium sp. GCM10030268]|uniref:MarR family winged helix-turn-helix transcriptional regulator n=1 Tax=Brachybacterium sp. GCM10030268 TaxID=3273382 RepID=UPI0036182E7C
MDDRVSDFLAQWQRERPDLDVRPMGVFGRISRVQELVSGPLQANFRQHGLNNGEFDTLATLRRAGAPYTLTPGELAASSMVTGAAMTNRLQRLEDKGMLERTMDPSSRRRVLVSLTAAGLSTVDEVVVDHLRTEQELLDRGLSPAEQEQLASLLATFLQRSGDASHDHR